MIYENVLVSDEEISFGSTGQWLHPPQTSTAITNPLKNYLPLTQVSRQLRDETTPMLFGRNTFKVLLSTQKDEALAQASLEKNIPRMKKPRLLGLLNSEAIPGSLTYGDRNAAAWTRIARPDAVAQIQHLTIEIENADSIARWWHLQQLYNIMSGPETNKVFSPRAWYLHAIKLYCKCFEVATWTVDFKEGRVRCESIKQVSPLEWQSRRAGRPCRTCEQLLRNWCKDYSAEGETLSKDHLLKLIWYDSQHTTLSK